MQEFAIFAYVIALGVLVYRAFMFGKRVIDVWASHNGWFWLLRPLFDGAAWSRLLQLATDITLSSLGMMFCRIAIAGTASAPIGALLGLSTSFLITGGSLYYQSQSKKRAQQGAAA